MRLLTLGCWSFGLINVFGIPLGDAQGIEFARRDEGNANANTGIAPQVWIPILIVILVMSALASLSWIKRALRRALGVTRPSPREVTAEQLAGQTGSGVPAGTVARNTRRSRGARRTNSQVSTRSLPAYMKEPGDQELVIIRAPPGLEDAQDAPTAGPLPVLNENDSETSGSGSRTSFYRAETPSPQNVPLLENHDSHDGGTLSPQSSRNSGGDGRRASMGVDETGVLGHAHSLYTMPTLSPAENQGRDSRGEAPPYSAPPYFEAILSGPIEEHHPDTTIQLGQEDPEPRRRSGFRGLLQALNLSTHSRVPTSPPTSQENPTSPPPGHNRVNSSFSVTSSLSHALPNPNRLSNRPHSPFRTLTHQRSYTAMNMNSSTLSVNSISAPLTHTLMRSDFTYPKSGPTPDQVRLISSPESITRFGIPYGPAAIAFAASNSRQDLHPPPDFDAVEGLRVRGTSRAAIGSFHQRGSSDASSGISHQQRRESNISSISSSSQLPASAPSPAETETANATLVETATVPTIAERRSHSPSAASHTGGGGGGGGKADENASAPTMAAHSPLTMDTTSSPSLRSAQLLPSRAESRASSLTSYATAAETLRVSSEESEISTPSTPRNAPMHIRGTSITV